METKLVTIWRARGSWSSKGEYREMMLPEAMAWMSKNGYKAVYAYTARDNGKRHITMRKPNCNTEYIITIK